jgi:hypothetical protein
VITITQTTSMELTGGLAVSGFGLPASPGGGAGQFAAAVLEGDSAGQAICNVGDGAILAKTGEEANGASGARFSRFFDPVAGRVGDRGILAAFEGVLAGVKGPARFGIWRSEPGDAQEAQLLTRGGTATPELADGVFQAFDSLALLDGRGPIFVAKYVLQTAGVPPRTARGLWAEGSDGALLGIFHEGDLIAGRPLKTFQILQRVAGSESQRRAWAEGDETPSLIFRAIFAHGAEAIVTATVP